MSEELSIFIESGYEPIVEMVLEESVADAILYDEDEVVVEALNKYVTMLEADDVDEVFEENLSVMLYPYMESISTVFEGANAAYFKKNMAAAKKAGKKFNKGKAMVPYKGKGKQLATTGGKGKGKKGFGAKMKKGFKNLRSRIGNSKLVKAIKGGYTKAKDFAGKKLGAMKDVIGTQMSRAKGAFGRKAFSASDKAAAKAAKMATSQ